jgi:retinol dehydrogenase-12
MVPPPGSTTPEGYDLQWGTNVMGHWILTTALLPLLSRPAEKGEEKARVVHTSSSGHRFAPRGTVDWESLKPEGSKRLGNWVLYGQVRRRSLIHSCLLWLKPLMSDRARSGISSSRMN